MTKVLCGFKDCIFIKDYNPDEEIGACSKEEIVLDERVEDIFVGCPDAEWRKTQGMNKQEATKYLEQMLIDALRMAPDKSTQAILLEIYIQEYGAISDENGEIIRQILMEQGGTENE